MRRFFLLMLTVWAGAASARACPGCQEAVQTSGNTGEILAGFSWSVLFLVGAVFLALGALGALLARAARRTEAGHAGAPERPQT